MKKLIALLAIFALYSCDKKKVEYFENGKVKNVYTLKNGTYHGLYESYDDLGNLKEVHIYTNGKKSDSSVYYTRTGNINHIDYYKDEIITYRKKLYPNGKIEEEGKMLQENFPIGIWKYYDDEGYLNQIKEIKEIQNKPYLNQNWFFDRDGDTIPDMSNYYTIRYEKDTVSLDMPIKAVVDVKAPLFKDKHPSVMVIVPKDYSKNFNADFSNMDEVIMDTIYNLNIEKDFRNQLNLDGDYSQSVLFGKYFNLSGPKKIRGIIVEYYYTKERIPDSLNQNYYEHKKYFEKEIYVKDTIN